MARVHACGLLAERRVDVGEYDWSSLYDQRPRPKGGSVFGDVHLSPPPKAYRVAIGIDLAYTEKTARTTPSPS